MDGQLEGGVVRLGDDARQRFHDSRGYGRPLDGGALALAPVEAAHLLARGDLGSIDGMGLRAFLETVERREGDVGTDFLVYADLRERGFYLSPAREGWLRGDRAVEGSGVTKEDRAVDGAIDFLVYPRGQGPWDGDVAYRVRCVGEREMTPAADLGEVILAVVDEEGELSYFETERPTIDGTTEHVLPTGAPGSLLADRVVLWNPPDALYERSFYGQRLGGRDAGSGPVQLSLVEAAFLAARGAIALTGDGDVDDADAANGGGDGTVADDEAAAANAEATVVERGRALEGERFGRRLAAYSNLRERGVVPKTGFKFGADFRTYADVESVDQLGHSEHLVRVLPRGHAFSLRDLALDVRLAGGVRKRMAFALTDGSTVDWLSVSRLTP
jgi:tRNA-intron endonuclease